MSESDEIRLIELIAGRMCHDLVGAVGAVANGVELLDDGKAAPDQEVMTLIADSARRANRRLQYFRMAYGTASGISGTGRLAEARKAASALFEGEPRVALDWPAATPEAEAASGRLVLLCHKLSICGRVNESRPQDVEDEHERIAV